MDNETYQLIDHHVVCLEIQSWRGISFNATHYYGKLRSYASNGQFTHADVEQVMTAEVAARLNKKDDTNGLYEAGDTTGRFDTRAAVIEAAVAQWRKSFPQGLILVEGRHWRDPCPVLVAPTPEFSQSAAGLWNQYRLWRDPYRQAPKTAVKLEARWERLFERTLRKLTALA